MRLIITVILLTITSKTFTQTNQLQDHERELEIQLNIQNINESRKDIDLRIFLGTGITNAGEIVHITRKKKKWKAFRYRYFLDIDDQDRLIDRYERDRLRPLDEWDKFWTRLKSLEIMNLPDQDEIQDKLRTKIVTKNGKEEWRQDYISDGSSYRLLLKDRGKIVSYTFDNPWTYSESYPEVKEVFYYSQIISTIEDQFSITFRN